MKRGSILIIALLCLLCVVLITTFVFAFTIWSNWTPQTHVPNYKLADVQVSVEGYTVTLTTTLTKNNMPFEGVVTFYRATEPKEESIVSTVGDPVLAINGIATVTEVIPEGDWHFIAEYNG